MIRRLRYFAIILGAITLVTVLACALMFGLTRIGDIVFGEGNGLVAIGVLLVTWLLGACWFLASKLANEKREAGK